MALHSEVAEAAGKKKKDKKKKEEAAQYELSRYQTRVRQVLDKLVNGELPGASRCAERCAMLSEVCPDTASQRRTTPSWAPTRRRAARRRSRRCR